MSTLEPRGVVTEVAFAVLSGGYLMQPTYIPLCLRVWTTSCWQGFFQICKLVGCARVYDLFARCEHRWPSCAPPDQFPIESTRSGRLGAIGFG